LSFRDVTMIKNLNCIVVELLKEEKSNFRLKQNLKFPKITGCISLMISTKEDNNKLK